MIGNDITTSLAEETNHLYSGVNIRGDTGDMSHSGRRTWAFIPISSNKNMKVAKELFRGGEGGGRSFYLAMGLFYSQNMNMNYEFI